VPVFEWVELNAIVEEMLERFSRVLGALVEQRAQLANTRDDVLGSQVGLLLGCWLLLQ